MAVIIIMEEEDKYATIWMTPIQSRFSTRIERNQEWIQREKKKAFSIYPFLLGFGMKLMAYWLPLSEHDAWFYVCMFNCLAQFKIA